MCYTQAVHMGAGMITFSVDDQRQLSIVTCSGKLTAEEVSDAIKKYYQGDPTPNVLWDIEQADLTALSADDVAKIAQLTSSERPDGLPGKTAIVSSQDLGFGMGRMFETYRQFEEKEVAMQVFRSLDEALAWMDE